MGGGSSPFNKAVGIASILNPVNYIAEIPSAINRTMAGLNTPSKTLSDNLSKSQELQSRQAAQMETDLAQTPRNISPDNFLANKAKMLQNMRLGLASTITGAGGSPAAPTLSSPSLTGKTKLGS